MKTLEGAHAEEKIFSILDRETPLYGRSQLDFFASGKNEIAPKAHEIFS